MINLYEKKTKAIGKHQTTTSFKKGLEIIAGFLILLTGVPLSAQTFPSPGLTLPAGKTICITYEVTVNADVCPQGTILANPNISNQSTVSGSNFSTVMTDDPDTGTPDDPTLTPIAALTLGNLVYEDVNRDGDFDVGTDMGIGDVLLNLYVDDGDGVLDAGDGSPIATTTTDDGTMSTVLGEYLFEGVCPGNYIVEVDPSNFNSGNALFDATLGKAFISSPSGAAPDPDNDVNNDDNGAPVSGFGVASQAVILAFGTEPTDDGDTDDNTNLSLDFGFKRPTQVTIDDPTVMEGDVAGDMRVLQFTVTRSDNVEAFSLDIAVTGGTATGGGTDYEDPSVTSVSFAASGSLTATFEVQVVEELTVEADETVEVTLSNDPPGVAITDAVGEGTIQNDDNATVTLSGGIAQDEGDAGTTVFTFTATLDNPVDGGFDLAFSVNDNTATDADDFDVATMSPLSFAGTAGEMETITVNVTGDIKVELDEDFSVSLGAVSNTSLSGNISTAGSPQTGTITNDDQATLTINDVSMSEGTGSNTTFTFTVTLDKVVDAGVSVDFQTADGTAVDENTSPNDYNSNSGMLNFTANTAAPQMMTIDVTVIGDMASEPDENFFINLSNIQANGRDVVFPSGDSQGEGTILDDDCDLPDVPTLSGNVSICPGASTTISVTAGNLDDATEWVLYSGSCGGTFEQANASGMFTVSPSATTDYFVRGEGGCVDQNLGACAMVTVTVNPNPTISLGASPAVCQGTTSADLPYTNTTASPDEYMIDYDATAEGQGFADVAFTMLPSSPIPLTVPVGAAPGTYNATIKVRNSGTGCVSSPVAFTVTVNANPTITLGASPAVCQGTTSADLPYTNTTASPDEYMIDYDATAEGQGFSDVAFTTLPSSPIGLTVPVGAAPGTYNATIKVRNSSTGCLSTAAAFTVTVNANPTITLGASPAVCQGTTSAELPYINTTASPDEYMIDYDATAEGQGFSDVAFTTLPSSPIGLTVSGAAAPGTYNAAIKVRNSSTGCLSSPVAFTVTVNANPTISLGASPAVCQGTTSADLPYTNTTASPDEYMIDYDATAEGQGFSDVAFTTLPSSPIGLTVSGAAAPGTYNAAIKVRNSSTGCVSSPVAFTVTVNANPMITLGASPAVCPGVTSADLPYTNTTANPDEYMIDYDVTAQGQGFADVAFTMLPSSPIALTVPAGAAPDTYNATIKVRNTTTGCVGSPVAFTLAVEDNDDPMAVCQNITVTLDAGTGTYTLMPSEIDGGSTDNCGIVLRQVNGMASLNFDCSDVGSHQVTLRVEDVVGRSHECMATVEVLASSACTPPAIANEGGPNISDPCSCSAIQGFFEEEVLITSTGPGQQWQLLLNTGLIDPSNFPAEYPASTLFVDHGDGTYTLVGMHEAGVGYSLVAVSPFWPNVELPISNTCYLPEVALITEAVCSGAAAGVILGPSTSPEPAVSYNITAIQSNGLTASAGNPVTGDGKPAAEIADDVWENPTGSSVNVVYTVVPVRSNGCEGDPFTVTLTVHPLPEADNAKLAACSPLGEAPGEAEFNLSEAEDQINSTGGVSFAYFEDFDLSKPIGDPQNYTGEDEEEIFVLVTDDITGCTDIAKVTLTVYRCCPPENLSAASPMDNSVMLRWSLPTVGGEEDFALWKEMGNGFEVILGAPDDSFTDEEETGNATHRIRIAGDDPNLSFNDGQFVYVVNANSDFIFGSAQIEFDSAQGELGSGLISATCYRAFVRQLCSMNDQGSASPWNFVNDAADAGDFCTTKGSFTCSATVSGKIDCESEGATITVHITVEPSGCYDANFDIFLNGERVRDDLKDGDSGDLDPDAGEIEYLINASKTGRYGNVGLNTVTVRQDGGTCTFKENECETEVEILSAPDAIACEDEMNVTLDDNCMAVVTVDMVTEGELCGAGRSDLEVIVYDGVYPNGAPDNMVEACGVFNYVLQYVGDDPNVRFTECWGRVSAEDKTPPEVTPKPAKVDGLWKYVDHYKNVQYTPYGCPYDSGNPYYDCFEDGYGALNDDCSTFTFNRLVCTDVDFIYKDSRSWSDGDYPYFTGRPKAEDACGPVTLVSVDDWLEEFTCEATVDQVVARITRTFTYRDAKGNETSENQVICFYRPVVQLPDCKVHVDVCDWDGTQTSLEPGNIKVKKGEIASPYYRNGLGTAIPLDGHACDLTITYKDTEFDAPCGTKVVREWQILDWCWNSAEKDRNARYLLPPNYNDCYLDDNDFNQQEGTWEQKTVTFEQHIIVQPEDELEVECNAADVSTGPFNCTAVVTLADLNVKTNACIGEAVVEFELWAYVEAPKKPGVYDFKRIGKSINGAIPGVEKGDYYVFLRAEDDCGRIYSSITAGQDVKSSQADCTISVVDKVEPTAVCDDELQVSLGGGNQYTSVLNSGVGVVKATDIDEGSWDNCGPVKVYARRSVSGCVSEYNDVVAGDPTINVAPLASNAQWTPWAEEIYFICCDLGETVRVELMVVDDANMDGWFQYGQFVNSRGELLYPLDNTNKCWLDIEPENKVKPNVEVEKEHIVCTMVDFDPNNPDEVAARFPWEDYITVDGNCSDFEVEEDSEFILDECNSGVIRRTFTITYGAKDESFSVFQYIKIDEVNDYYISFPGDEEGDCADIDGTDVMYDSDGCDILAVNRDTVRYEGSDDECFKRLITYSVINWCEYDGETLEPTIIPRDLDQDGSKEEDILLVAEYDDLDDYDICNSVSGVDIPSGTQFLVKIYDDEDGDKQVEKDQLPVKILVRGDCVVESDIIAGHLVTESHVGPLVLRLSEQSRGGYYPDEACYEVYCSDEVNYGITDRDAVGKAGHGEVFDDVVDYLCENRTYIDQCWTPGFYQYTQLQKIFDNEAPTVEVTTEDLTFEAYGKDCTGPVEIEFTVTDDCTAKTNVRRVRVFPDEDLGLGPITLDFERNSDTSFTVVVPEGEPLFGVLPTGDHVIEISAVDNCGNPVKKLVPITVVDAGTPAPICIFTLSVDLMPVDEDRDGSISGMNTVWATDYIASGMEDCTPHPDPDFIDNDGDGESDNDLKYFVFSQRDLDSLSAGFGFTVDPDTIPALVLRAPSRGDTIFYGQDTLFTTASFLSVTFTCDDVSGMPTFVYGMDGQGNADYCTVMTTVVPGADVDCGAVDPDDGDGTVSGLITTDELIAVAGVNVQLSGQASMNYLTDDNGDYQFNGLIEGYDYTVTPSLDQNHLNGVSTFDLVLISKHILGVKPLNSPYKLLAADVNNSRSITTLDLIQLRKLILSVDTKFSNNASWRFVDASYVFPNPANPWAEEFPEVKNINNLNGEIVGDFIAIKVGDANLNARANGLMAAAPRNVAGVMTLQAAQVDMTGGEEYTVAITAEDLAMIQGYQFTLNYDRNMVELVDVLEGVATEEHFGIFAEQGMITTSWNGQASSEVLFSLVLRAKRNTPLSEVLSISSRLTRAEAYSTSDELLDVALDFGQGAVARAGFELYQNQPNPFNGQTIISFNLPEAAQATITVSDVTGRTLKVIDGDYAKGYNQLKLNRSELQATGVLTYTIETNDFTATKKMIITE